MKYLTAPLIPQAIAHPLTALEGTYLGDVFVPKNVCWSGGGGGERRERERREGIASTKRIIVDGGDMPHCGGTETREVTGLSLKHSNLSDS